MMELFAENSCRLLAVNYYQKSSIIDIWKGQICESGIHSLKCPDKILENSGEKLNKLFK